MYDEETRTIQENSTRKPFLVWIIFIHTLIVFIISIFSYYMILAGKIPMDIQQRSYLNELSLLDHLVAIFSLLLIMAGSIFLILLKKRSIYFFTISFIINLATNIYYLYFKTWNSGIIRPKILSVSIGLLIQVVIIYYILFLRKKGKLN
jgi:hypothetical protein